MAPAPALRQLDEQILEVRAQLQDLSLSEERWTLVASSIHDEVGGLGAVVVNRLRNELVISPEDYLDELMAFQAWMDIAHANSENPVIVRAQVMTQLYVAFVWLRDSLMEPLSAVVTPDGAAGRVIDFLRTDDRRRLRNAVAHGRWRYLQDFNGLECWDGQPPARFDIQAEQLGAWQLLSRASQIAVLLAIADS